MSALIAVCDSLNRLIAAVLSPEVSLPRQNVTSPLAPSAEAGSMALAPLSEPPPPPPPSSSSPPHAATNTAHASAAHNRYRSLLDTSSPSVLVGLIRNVPL